MALLHGYYCIKIRSIGVRVDLRMYLSARTRVDGRVCICVFTCVWVYVYFSPAYCGFMCAWVRMAWYTGQKGL